MRSRFLLALFSAVALGAVSLAGAAAQSYQTTKACGPAPHKISGKPMLPAKFPTPAKVVYTSSKKLGPTTVVTGYYANGNLTAIHHAYSNALKAAGYEITHEEQDAADSEVNWAKAKQTGQVKLSKRCDSRILITLTIRPA
jgi:hypothetical protein